MRPRGGSRLSRPTPAFTFIAPTGLSPQDSHACCTPWSVFQEVLCVDTTASTTGAQGVIDPPHERACRQRTLHAVPTAVHKRTEATRPEGLRCTRENSRLSSVAPRPPDGWLYVLRTSAEVPPNRPSGPGATAVGRLPTGVRGSREPIQARTHRLPAPGTFPDIP